MEGNILDFTKIKCRDHPLEIISNYCLNQNCMTGLCSQCVCMHTEMHLKSGSSPIFKPLKDIHKSIYDQLSNYIRLFQSDKDRIMNIMKNISQRKNNYKIILQEAKKEVSKTIDKVFIELQLKFQEEVKNQLKKTGLHSSFQIQSLCRKVNREISNLVNEGQLLNSNKFLDVIKTIKVNTFNQVDKVRNQILKQIKQNQEFVPNIDYKRQFLGQIENSVRKLFCQSFMYPKVVMTPVKQPIFSRQTFNCIDVVSQNKQNTKIMQRSDGFKSMIQNPVIHANCSIQNMRNSLLVGQPKYQIQIPKHDRSSSNILQRSNSSSTISYVQQIPQYLDSSNFPFQIQRKQSGIPEMRMTGSRIFTQTGNRR